AVYALLYTGTDWLTDNEPVQVSFPRANRRYFEARIEAAEASAEAGTGYYQVQWPAEEVRSDLGMVRLRNRNQVPAWGGLYWQYFQDIDQVEALTDNPLQLERQLLRRSNTGQGDELVPLNESPRPGDRITVRLIVRTDRDMEFLHLKDLRASGLEPIEQLSGYRWQDGLGYYQSTTDLGTHFFFDRLPRGTYVLEYDLYVTYRGDFANGLATLQCMYAPAFSSRSSGGRLKVE
ncbi:MAG: alpha-2-macroglobulin, partial [Lewinella sp.]|nr:alpha-2-macroglobulin [Lewinella sp.]